MIFKWYEFLISKMFLYHVNVSVVVNLKKKVIFQIIIHAIIEFCEGCSESNVQPVVNTMHVCFFFFPLRTGE